MTEIVLLYDADCGFCRWSLDKILRRDHRGAIRPVPIQSAEGKELLAGMDEERRMESWHVVTPDGRVLSAGAAIPEIARHLTGGAPVSGIASRFPRSTDRLYRFVAKNRHRWGRALGEQACSVDPSARPSDRR